MDKEILKLIGRDSELFEDDIKKHEKELKNIISIQIAS